jgi:hypothetical protein
MAQKKISGMTAASSCTGAELIEVVQSSTSKQATLSTQVKAYFDTLYPAKKTYITAQATPTRVTGAAPDAIGEYRSYLRNAGARTYTETNGAPTTAPSSSNGYKLHTSADFATVDSNGEPSRYEIYIGTGKEPVFEFYSGTGRTGYISAFPFQRYAGTDVNGGFDVSYDPVTGIVQVFNPPYHGMSNYTGLTALGVTVTADIYFDIKC